MLVPKLYHQSCFKLVRQTYQESEGLDASAASLLIRTASQSQSGYFAFRSNRYAFSALLCCLLTSCVFSYYECADHETSGAFLVLFSASEAHAQRHVSCGSDAAMSVDMLGASIHCFNNPEMLSRQ